MEGALLEGNGLGLFDYFFCDFVGRFYELDIMNLLDLRLHEKFILFIVHSCIIIFKLALQNPKQTSQKVATFYCGEEEEQLFQDKIEK